MIAEDSMLMSSTMMNATMLPTTKTNTQQFQPPQTAAPAVFNINGNNSPRANPNAGVFQSGRISTGMHSVDSY